MKNNGWMNVLQHPAINSLNARSKRGCHVTDITSYLLILSIAALYL